MNSSSVMFHSKSLFSSIDVISNINNNQTIDEGYLPKIKQSKSKQ